MAVSASSIGQAVAKNTGDYFKNLGSDMLYAAVPFLRGAFDSKEENTKQDYKEGQAHLGGANEDMIDSLDIIHEDLKLHGIVLTRIHEEIAQTNRLLMKFGGEGKLGGGGGLGGGAAGLLDDAAAGGIGAVVANAVKGTLVGILSSTAGMAALIAAGAAATTYGMVKANDAYTDSHGGKNYHPDERPEIEKSIDAFLKEEKAQREEIVNKLEKQNLSEDERSYLLSEKNRLDKDINAALEKQKKIITDDNAERDSNGPSTQSLSDLKSAMVQEAPASSMNLGGATSQAASPLDADSLRRAMGGGGPGPSSLTAPGSHGPVLEDKSSSGAFTPSGTAGSLNDLVAQEALKAAGGDPDKAARIRQTMNGIRSGESYRGNKYDHYQTSRENSWGPWQLNDLGPGALGSVFEQETAAERKRLGLGDLSDPRTIPMQTAWVAKYLADGRSMAPWGGPNWPTHHPREADPKWGNSGYDPEMMKLYGQDGKPQGSPGPTGKSGDYSGLNILPGHGATAGGKAQPGLIDAARYLQKNDPNLVGFTALNDEAHKNGLGSGPMGPHGQGRAFDAASKDIEGSKKILRDYLTSQGFKEGAWGTNTGDFSLEPGTGAGTGPHVHFQWNSDKPGARFASLQDDLNKPKSQADFSQLDHSKRNQDGSASNLPDGVNALVDKDNASRIRRGDMTRDMGIQARYNAGQVHAYRDNFYRPEDDLTAFQNNGNVLTHALETSTQSDMFASLKNSKAPPIVQQFSHGGDGDKKAHPDAKKNPIEKVAPPDDYLKKLFVTMAPGGRGVGPV